MKRASFVLALAGLLVFLAVGIGWPSTASSQTDPLPSWNDTPTKQAIVDFVGRVTKAGGPDFIAPAERIATFDNDGTLWVEQPMYVQLAFALDRVKALAPMHPEWKDQQPFKAVLDGDMKALAETGEHGAVQLITVTPRGHDHGGVRKDRNGLACHCARCAVQAAVY